MIQVYTGNGKGKTTAAFGQALRALGKGMSVYVIQFLKGENHYGEVQALSKLPGVLIEQFGQKDMVNVEFPQERDRDLALKGLNKSREVIESGIYDLIILDEVNVAASWGLIPLEELLQILKSAPPDIEVVLTGRYAPPEVLSLADLITEMLDRKHYYNKGLPAREGIEY